RTTSWSRSTRSSGTGSAGRDVSAGAGHVPLRPRAHLRLPISDGVAIVAPSSASAEHLGRSCAAPMHSSVSDLVARLVRAFDEAPSAPVRVSGLRGSAAALCLARLIAARARPVLVTCATATEAEAFAADVRFFLGAPALGGPLVRRVHYLPGWEVPPFEAL